MSYTTSFNPSIVAQANWDFLQTFLLTNTTTNITQLVADSTLCGDTYAFCYDPQGKCPQGVTNDGSMFSLFNSAFEQVMGEYSNYITFNFGTGSTPTSAPNCTSTSCGYGKDSIAPFYQAMYSFNANLNNFTKNLGIVPCADSGSSLGLVTQFNQFLKQYSPVNTDPRLLPVVQETLANPFLYNVLPSANYIGAGNPPTTGTPNCFNPNNQ